jgi:hypothetical protein
MFQIRNIFFLGSRRQSVIHIHHCCSIYEFLRIVSENLEAKMKWLKNFERVQELQQQIIWRPITELEPRAFIPEVRCM